MLFVGGTLYLYFVVSRLFGPTNLLFRLFCFYFVLFFSVCVFCSSDNLLFERCRYILVELVRLFFFFLIAWNLPALPECVYSQESASLDRNDRTLFGVEDRLLLAIVRLCQIPRARVHTFVRVRANVCLL